MTESSVRRRQESIPGSRCFLRCSRIWEVQGVYVQQLGAPPAEAEGAQKGKTEV